MLEEGVLVEPQGPCSPEIYVLTLHLSQPSITIKKSLFLSCSQDSSRFLRNFPARCTPASLAFLPQGLHICIFLFLEDFSLATLPVDTFSFFFSPQLMHHFSEAFPNLPINELPPPYQLSQPSGVCILSWIFLLV